MKLNSLHRVILCSLFAVTTVYAAGDKPVMFEDIDTNADGCISSKEAAVREDLVKNFDSIDKDKNGALCLDEYSAYENKDAVEPHEVETPELGSAPTK